MNKYGQWLMLWMLPAIPLVHAGTVTYVYTDPQGTPLAEADANGNITARFEYTPYGASVSSMGAAPNGVGYTGHVNDPDTGLVYMQARYYDPAMGRFLSVDPVTAYDKPGQNFNRYWYANDNPARYTDPDGRNPLNPVDVYYFAKDVGGLLVTEMVAGAAFVTGNDEVLSMALADMSTGALDAAASTIDFASPASGAGKGLKAARMAGDVAEGTKKAAAVAKRAENVAKGVPESQLGPSGKPKIHVVNHGGDRKAAKDAARAEVGKGGSAVNHTSPAVGQDHYHGVTQSGEKSRIHHEYND